MTQEAAPSDISLAEAFELVVLTRAQAQGILFKMAELFTDSAPNVKEAFLTAADMVVNPQES